MCLDVDVNPNMPRAKSKAVPEDNGHFPHDDCRSAGGLMMEKIYRTFVDELGKCFDRKTGHFDQRFKDREEENKNAQYLAGLQHQAQQPRLVAEADANQDTKTRQRAEGAAADGEIRRYLFWPGRGRPDELDQLLQQYS